jgi:hypothetical protein
MDLEGIVSKRSGTVRQRADACVAQDEEPGFSAAVMPKS